MKQKHMVETVCINEIASYGRDFFMRAYSSSCVSLYSFLSLKEEVE